MYSWKKNKIFFWSKIAKPSALKREHPALQNMKFLNFILFLWAIFALLDPDTDPLTWLNPKHLLCVLQYFFLHWELTAFRQVFWVISPGANPLIYHLYESAKSWNCHVLTSVSDPDSVRWVDPYLDLDLESGSGRAKWPMFWSAAGCSLLRAEGFFCSLDVLSGG